MAKAKEKAEAQAPAVDLSLSLAERRALAQQAAFKAIQAKFGANSIGMAENMTYRSRPRITSGVFALDFALGGGWPLGCVNLIWGGKSCSKTTLMLRALGLLQKTDALTGKFLWELTDEEREKAVPRKVGMLDAEGTFDPNWAARQGMNVAELWYSKPTSAEEAGDMLEAMLLSGAVDAVLVDSIAALITMAELEGDMADQQMGVGARANAKMLRKVQRVLNKLYRENTGVVPPTLFMINQIRMKIGISFGSPETKTGGVAQDFFASTIVKMSGNKVTFYDPKECQFPRWSEFNFKIDANKTAAPKIEGSFKMGLADDPEGEFRMGEIIEKKDVVDFAERVGIIVKESPTKWRIGDEEFKTKTALLQKYVDNEEQYLVLRKQVLAKAVPKQ